MKFLLLFVVVMRWQKEMQTQNQLKFEAKIFFMEFSFWNGSLNLFQSTTIIADLHKSRYFRHNNQSKLE